MKKLSILQHIDREGPSLFLSIASELGIETSLIRVDLGDPIPQFNENCALLILGGPMGINDLKAHKYPWLDYEFMVIKAALRNRIPMIGICLGAQLIAYAAGGGITKLEFGEPPVGKSEIGWSEIRFDIPASLNKSPLAKFKSMEVLHWHSDRIILPPKATLIASSIACREQFYTLPHNVYGLQFHIEITNSDFLRWIDEDSQIAKSVYGINAKAILLDNNKMYINRSKNKRISLIRNLLEMTCM